TISSTTRSSTAAGWRRDGHVGWAESSRPTGRFSGGPRRLDPPYETPRRRSNMQTRGVILAGGKGTRLGELTKVTNKHLLPVGPYPMVYQPLKKLVDGGIKDIMLVSGTEHMGDFVELLGAGRE